MADLPFTPQFPAPAQHSPRVLKAQFGDGYEQRAADGINNIATEYDLQFTLTQADSATLLDFFKGLAGVTKFTWQPPGAASAMLWVCDDWSESLRSRTVKTINAHIYRVFEA